MTAQELNRIIKDTKEQVKRTPVSKEEYMRRYNKIRPFLSPVFYTPERKTQVF